jgi:hypothetical protein
MSEIQKPVRAQMANSKENKKHSYRSETAIAGKQCKGKKERHEKAVGAEQ